MENNTLLAMVVLAFAIIGCATVETIPENNEPAGRVFMDKSVASVDGAIPDGTQVICNYTNVDRSLHCISIEKFFVESFARSGYNPKFE